MTNQTKFEFHPAAWDIKTIDRSKNRMKFKLKLNQEESDAFRNFANTVKPDNISLDEFVRSIFFQGIRALEQELTTNMVSHIEENRAEYEASGFTFDEEGKLTGVAEAEGDIEITE